MEGRPMSSLSELIERVENASGPDRLIDGDIALAVGWEGESRYTSQKWSNTFPGCREHWRYDREPFDNWKVPRYTESIDAALTLLPDGYAIDRLSIWKGSPSRCIVLGTHLKRGEYWHIHSDGMWEAEAATPALALVAACLKARLLDAASSEARG
jgi:hypothetical protein